VSYSDGRISDEGEEAETRWRVPGCEVEVTVTVASREPAVVAAVELSAAQAGLLLERLDEAPLG
jgi:hypothetical protein